MAGEEEYNPCQEGAPRRYHTDYNHREEERRKYEERRTIREIKETSKELNRRGDDDDLVEEIMKILKNGNIMEKVGRRINGDRGVKQDEIRSIENERDWDNPVSQTFDIEMPQKFLNKRKV